jgi:putative variable surface protein, vspH
MTALDNNFRVNIPISVGVGQQSYYKKNDSLKGTIVVSTAFEGRYYFNTKYFSHLRLYFGYGNATIEEVNDSSIYFTQESVGFQLRAYFNYDFSSYNMKLTPIIRLQFDKALETRYNNMDESTDIVDNYYITAKGFAPSGGARIGGVSVSSGANADLNNGSLKGGYIASIPNPNIYYAKEPYRIGIAFPIGFRAMNESKTIEVYVEPALSFTIVNAKDIYSYQGVQTGSYEKRRSSFYTFGYVVYGELYIRPIPQLEWYTELQTGGATVAGDLANTSSGGSTSIILNASTGITWYF